MVGVPIVLSITCCFIKQHVCSKNDSNVFVSSVHTVKGSRIPTTKHDVILEKMGIVVLQNHEELVLEKRERMGFEKAGLCLWNTNTMV